MNKGTFQSPRSLGTVAEFRVSALDIKLKDGELVVSVVIQEGEEIGGVFTPHFTKEQLVIEEKDLLPQNQALISNLMKFLLQEYADKEGYSNVTVT